MAITTGMAIAAGVSAASSLAGGAIAGKASKKAARVQEEASKRADAAQERRYQEQLALQEPFRQGGLTAQDQIMQLLGIGGDKTAAGYGSLAKSFDELYGGDKFQQDPGYQFRVDESIKALDRSAAARGNVAVWFYLERYYTFGQDARVAKNTRTHSTVSKSSGQRVLTRCNR
jgi:hypothetical protein